MRERKGEHPWGDAGQLVLLFLFLIIWIGDSFILHLSTFLAYRMPSVISAIILVATVGISLFLFQSGHQVIHHDSHPTGVKTDGAFAMVRHPLYLASLLTYLGLSLSTLSLISLLLLVGIFIFYNYIAGYEEQILLEKYGEEYHRYQVKTGKWLPRIAK
jgi:protein-S-isoprenylcysteine O-methyltransferase Ste14